jgi:RNA polymerase sigma-B factor
VTVHSTIAPDEAQLLVRFARTRDVDARERLVERYLPLARSVARRYARGNEPLDDLMQVASLGLLKAIDRFDPDRGLAFSSFAVPTIAGELRRHFRDRCWTVRPPRGISERMLQVDRATNELGARLGRPPTVREIGQALELTDEDVLEAWQARRDLTCASLDEPAPGHDTEDATRGDELGVVDPGFARARDRATLEALATDLTERERRVLELRFEHDLTQDEIGRQVGVSQMQVSRLIRGAVAKLSEAANSDARGQARERA